MTDVLDRTTPIHPEQLTRSLLDVSVDGLMAFDRELRYIAWNAAMERISGLSEADVVGKRAFELFPFLVETGEERCYHQALAGETVDSVARPFFVIATQRRGFYDAHYAPLRDDVGRIVGGVAVVRDTTDRDLTEAKVREIEARFQNMADASPVLLWMSGTDGLCTFFNQTWLTFTGRALEDEWGVGWAEGVHFEDFQRCMDTYLAAFNARKVFEMEYRLMRADGEYRWILDRGTPRYLPDGTFAGYIGSCVDITERKVLEVELREAVRARDEFLSIASHELRTPLTSLQLQLEGLLRTLDRKPEQALSSGRIASSATMAKTQSLRLVTLVNQLLDVSRIAAGRLVLEYEDDVDIAAVAEEVVDRYRALAAQSGTVLTLRSPAKGVMRGAWDRSRVDQVLTNLVSNAVKYGAGKPVEIDMVTTGDLVRIRVTDQGIGIAPEARARLFQRFERAKETRNYGGLGLGLWISREIAHAMGGSIELEQSAPGAGATFAVDLPARPPAHVARSPISEESQEHAFTSE